MTEADKKNEFMETQMFLMQTTMKHMSSEVKELRQLNTEMRDSQNEMMLLLKKLTEPKSSQEANVSEKRKPILEKASVNGFVATPTAVASKSVPAPVEPPTETTEKIEKRTSNIADWMSYVLPDDPCAVRIILENIEKSSNWKETIGNSLPYLQNIAKWIEEKRMQEIQDSKADLFIKQLFENYSSFVTNMLKAIEVAPLYYRSIKEPEADLTSYRTKINLEKAMKEKGLPAFEVIKYTSKSLLAVHLRVVDETVCWRTQQLIYFISGSDREGDASEKKRPVPDNNKVLFNGNEKKLAVKDAIQELALMVKSEELRSDFLCSFWDFSAETRVKRKHIAIKFSDVYESLCYHFYSSADDRRTICAILVYLVKEAFNRESLEFMLKNKVTKNFYVELDGTKEKCSDERAQWLYARLLCRVLAEPRTVWEQCEPNGGHEYAEAVKLVTQFCTVRPKMSDTYKNKLAVYPLNEKEPTNQLFATFLFLNRLVHNKEQCIKNLQEECGDSIYGLLEKIESKQCEPEDSVGLRIVDNTKQILKHLKEKTR